MEISLENIRNITMNSVVSFAKANPGLLMKAVPVAVVGWYCIPVIGTVIYVAPWIYLAYEVSNHATLAKSVYNGAMYVKNMIY